MVDLALKYRDDKENIIKLWNSQDPIDLSYINKNEIAKFYEDEFKTLNIKIAQDESEKAST